jgi:HlyD family secretion protein
MKRKNLKVILSIVAVTIVAIVVVKFTGGKEKVTFNTATISKGTIELTVMATGDVQPVEVVEVGTQVSGVIEKIFVDYNSHVKKGQLLAKLETNTLMEKVNQAKSSLRASESDLNYASQNHKRVKMLYETNAATKVAYEEAINKLNQAETTFENAKATLKQAEVDLSYAYIYSPIDGVILERAVNTGQTVAAAFTTPTFFTIAEDLTKMQVEADIDEADIGQVRVGQHVSFTVDSYPKDTFSGTVSQLRLQPVVTSNVVTYTVIVKAPNPDKKLFPGMTANIYVTVASEKGLLVPVEAVNFQMDKERLAELNIVDTETKVGNGVWIKTGNKIERRQINTGLGDGIFFLAKSGLSEGEQVILSTTSAKKPTTKEEKSIMPSPPKNGGGNAPTGVM